MRRAMRLVTALGILGIVGSGLSGRALEAGPPRRPMSGSSRTIESIRQAWAAPGAKVNPNQDGWNALFDALLQDLHAYAKAGDDTERLTAVESGLDLAGTGHRDLASGGEPA